MGYLLHRNQWFLAARVVVPLDLQSSITDLQELAFACEVAVILPPTACVLGLIQSMVSSFN